MHYAVTAIVLAAHPTPLEKLRHLPHGVWLNVAIFIIGAFVIVRLWRTLRSVNDYAPYLAIGVFGTCVFFYWVYTRTEPAFLTPIVERLTPFFPTQATQQDSVQRARSSRD